MGNVFCIHGVGGLILRAGCDKIQGEQRVKGVGKNGGYFAEGDGEDAAG